MVYQNLELKDYVKKGTLFSTRKTWEVRSHMLDVAGNFPGHRKYEPSNWMCQACGGVVREDQEHLTLGLFDMPNSNRFDILSISIFSKISLSISISIFSKTSLSISISIFTKISLSISISISIFFRFALSISISISIFSKMTMSISISISIFFKSVDISTIDIRYRYIEQA